MDAFERDLNTLLDRFDKLGDRVRGELERLRGRLLTLRTKNRVKINHSVMELICARYLIEGGYRIDLEHPLNGLTCDVYGVKGYGTLIVEVETGFIPPKHALNPLTYVKARIASKLIRYGNHANKFGIGTPPHYVLQIPSVLTKPPQFRNQDELAEIKALCDHYYTSPPITLEEIRYTRLHAVYVIDVDDLAVDETDPATYLERFPSTSFL
jgi:hypothetical protein